jgi:hypothetical protein
LATGTSNWSAQVVLQPGPNLFQAYARDIAGNVSSNKILNLVYVVYDQLNLQIVGSGSVTPDPRGQPLEIGKSYTLTAKPGKGWIFAGWSGTFTASQPILALQMQPHVALTATFIPNPFVPLKGNYQGLFYPTNETATVETNNAGAVGLTLTDQGAFSGKLSLEGASLGFKGQFDGQGAAQVSIARQKKSPLQLSIFLTEGEVRGRLTDGSWDSSVRALRVSASKTNRFAGPYTVLLTAAPPTLNSPPGDGVATLSVAAAGTVKLTGTLADGTTVSYGTGLTEDGDWPVYISLYRGQGLLLGWLTMGASTQLGPAAGDSPAERSGAQSLVWIKPPVARDRYYATGFRDHRAVTLARYTAPRSTQNAVEWLHGGLLFGGDTFTGIYTNRFLATNGQFKIARAGLAGLQFTFTPNNGAWSGSFNHPDTKARVAFKGVLIQRTNPSANPDLPSFGGGWFLGATHGGWIRLQPMDPPSAEENRGRLVSSTRLQSFNKSILSAFFKNEEIPLNPLFGVTVYKITYETVDPFGRLTRASGAVTIPQNARGPAPLLSYQHGTLLLKTEAPSAMGEEVRAGVAFSSMGYVCALPDYLGLGDSPGFHPYLHAKSEATAVVDMLRATRAFCEVQSVALNSQLFLCGYSQGGHATMAAHREIERLHRTEFNITASAPMAGAYDLSGVTREDFMSGRPVPNPYYLAYLLGSYRLIYPAIGAWTDILAVPFDQTIPPLLDGRHAEDEVNQALPPYPRDLFSATFLHAFETDPQHPFWAALRDNDLLDWTPQAPLRLFHCQGDQDVTFANSEKALDYFHQHGAPQVQLIDPDPSADHEEGFLLCMIRAIEWFATFKP